MDQILSQLQSAPKKISLLNKITKYLLSDKNTVANKLLYTSKIIEIVAQYFEHLSPKTHQKSYEIVCQFVINLAKMFFMWELQIDSSDIQMLLELKQQILGNYLVDLIEICPIKIKKQIVEICSDKILQSTVTQQFLSEKSVTDFQNKWSSIKNCQLLTQILLKIGANINTSNIQQTHKHLLLFLISIDSIQNLDSNRHPIYRVQQEQTKKQYKQKEQQKQLQRQQKQQLLKGDSVKRFKEKFQNVFIDLLDYYECIQVQHPESDKNRQILLWLYRHLGDRIFSKMDNVFIMAQYLVQKFTNHDIERTDLQIQVLSALFILVGKQGLELEQFYRTLQQILLKPRKTHNSLFRQKNSKRFLKLVQSSMRSSRVPFTMILSLCKLIISKTMVQESSFNFWALALFVNLVKKHRQLQKHLHEFPELEILKMHHSSKIRALISQLPKNMNKTEYLQIEQFQRISTRKICDRKVEEICEQLSQNQQQIQFKFIPGSYAAL